MEAAGLHSIREYIRKRQATIAYKVTCGLIYEICAEEERMLGTIWMVRWWDQDVVNEPTEWMGIMCNLT